MCDGQFSSSIRHNREKLPPLQSPYNEDFVSELEEFLPHLKEARFFGGEPFLTKIYFEIWERMFELCPNAIISVQTNGTVLNDKIKKVLERGRFKLSISIDAVEKEMFESIRLNANFDRVMKNVEFFAAYCKEKQTELLLSVTPIAASLSHLPEVIRFANGHEMQVIFNTVFYPLELSPRSMSAAELKAVVLKLETAQLPSGSSREIANQKCYDDFVGWLRHLIQSASSEPTVNDEGLLARLEPFLNNLKEFGLQNLLPREQEGAKEPLQNKAIELIGLLAKSGAEEAILIERINNVAVEDVIHIYPHRLDFSAFEG
jgi:hypothetical protein